MARWHFCNILRSTPDTRRVWQFQASSKKFNVSKEEIKLIGEPLNQKLYAKDWETLVQPKLNVAWLPADQVFLRVVQIPKMDAEEIRPMLDLQLEKLSPMPVAQVVWSYDLLDHPEPGMQTAVIIIVSRQHVDRYLTELEELEFHADRLELPFLDQLKSEFAQKDGAWIYPGWGSDRNACILAWWQGGVLRDLSLIRLPADQNRVSVFQDQVKQMVWSGELDGWLTEEPHFFLVTEPDQEPGSVPEAAEAVGDEATPGDGDEAAGEQSSQDDSWESLFQPEQSVEVVPPIPMSELAEITARRVVANGSRTNLLPTDYTARYKQRFVDRLWMRGVGATVALYMLCVAVYFGWVEVAKWKLSSIQDEINALGSSYTNTVRLKEKITVLQDQMDLQYAALDAWKAAAIHLPADLELESINFDRGVKVTYFGSAPPDGGPVVNDFNESIRTFMVNEKPLFERVDGPRLTQNPATKQNNWSFACYLRRSAL